VTVVRHLTASAIVLDEHDRVLVIHHNKSGKWQYPGGHLGPNEDPAEAAQREVLEETGIHTRPILTDAFTHPAVHTHPTPFTIIEADVADPTFGPHRHIDMVYVLRATYGHLTAQLDEVSAARWVPLDDLAGYDMPPELPTLFTQAVQWAKQHS
jgi:8-oxo-dGTP pyrophosphatase MutT (NUDIX family)